MSPTLLCRCPTPRVRSDGASRPRACRGRGTGASDAARVGGTVPRASLVSISRRCRYAIPVAEWQPEAAPAAADTAIKVTHQSGHQGHSFVFSPCVLRDRRRRTASAGPRRAARSTRSRVIRSGCGHRSARTRRTPSTPCTRWGPVEHRRWPSRRSEPGRAHTDPPSCSRSMRRSPPPSPAHSCRAHGCTRLSSDTGTRRGNARPSQADTTRPSGRSPPTTCIASTARTIARRARSSARTSRSRRRSKRPRSCTRRSDYSPRPTRRSSSAPAPAWCGPRTGLARDTAPCSPPASAGRSYSPPRGRRDRPRRSAGQSRTTCWPSS